jgi:hypothetical protein
MLIDRSTERVRNETESILDLLKNNLIFADRFLLIITQMENLKGEHLMRLLKCDIITLDITNWLRGI